MSAAVRLAARVGWVLGAAVVITGSAHGADIYKWIDKDGSVHYGTQPPAWVTPTRIDAPAPLSPQAQQQAATQRERLREQSDRAQVERNAEQQRQAERDDELRGTQGLRAEACRRARHDLSVLQEQQRVYHRNDKGERVYLDDSARDGEIRRATERQNTYCAGLSDADVAAADRARRPNGSPACMAALQAARDAAAAGVPPAQLALARDRARQACSSNP